MGNLDLRLSIISLHVLNQIKHDSRVLHGIEPSNHVLSNTCNGPGGAEKEGGGFGEEGIFLRVPKSQFGQPHPVRADSRHECVVIHQRVPR